MSVVGLSVILQNVLGGWFVEEGDLTSAEGHVGPCEALLFGGKSTRADAYDTSVSAWSIRLTPVTHKLSRGEWPTTRFTCVVPTDKKSYLEDSVP